MKIVKTKSVMWKVDNWQGEKMKIKVKKIHVDEIIRKYLATFKNIYSFYTVFPRVIHLGLYCVLAVLVVLE